MHVAGGAVVRLVHATLAGRPAADIVDAVPAVLSVAIRVGARPPKSWRVAGRAVDLGRLGLGRRLLRGGQSGSGEKGGRGQQHHGISGHSYSPLRFSCVGARGSAATVTMMGSELAHRGAIRGRAGTYVRLRRRGDVTVKPTVAGRAMDRAVKPFTASLSGQS